MRSPSPPPHPPKLEGRRSFKGETSSIHSDFAARCCASPPRRRLAPGSAPGCGGLPPPRHRAPGAAALSPSGGRRGGAGGGMPVLPERLTSRQEVRDAIGAQFWDMPVQSARSADGLTWSLPCEPAPLAQTYPSGLSRTQQLLAAQAVLLPALPAFDGAAGGVVSNAVLYRPPQLSSRLSSEEKCCEATLSLGSLPVQVLDRVLARTGGYTWWTTLAARARAQHMWNQHRNGARVVRVWAWEA